MIACLRCGWPVSIWPPVVRPEPFCSGKDLVGCLERAFRLESPLVIFEPEPVWVSLDSFRPEDIGVCTECRGTGQIETQRRDYGNGGFRIIECPRCDTSGIEPTYEPWSGLATHMKYVATLRRMEEPV